MLGGPLTDALALRAHGASFRGWRGRFRVGVLYPRAGAGRFRAGVLYPRAGAGRFRAGVPFPRARAGAFARASLSLARARALSHGRPLPSCGRGRLRRASLSLVRARALSRGRPFPSRGRGRFRAGVLYPRAGAGALAWASLSLARARALSHGVPRRKPARRDPLPETTPHAPGAREHLSTAHPAPQPSSLLLSSFRWKEGKRRAGGGDGRKALPLLTKSFRRRSIFQEERHPTVVPGCS